MDSIKKDTDDELTGMWQIINRQRSRLSPLLGSYKTLSRRRVVSGQTQKPDLTHFDYKQRDQFTKTVKLLNLPRRGVPDIQFLQRMGYCLPSEPEVLHSQHTVRSMSKTSEFDFLKSLEVPEDRQRKETCSSTGSYPLNPTAVRNNVWGNLLNPAGRDIRQRTVQIRMNEIQRQICTRRQIEDRIMQSKLNYFQERMKQSCDNARPSEDMVRKHIFNSLDEDNRKSIYNADVDKQTRSEKDSNNKTFSEWKNKMMVIMDEQAEKDLRVAMQNRFILKPKSFAMFSKVVKPANEDKVPVEARSSSHLNITREESTYTL